MSSTPIVPEDMNFMHVVVNSDGRLEHKWFPELDDALRYTIPFGKNIRLHIEDKDGNLALSRVAAWEEIERRWQQIMARPLRY